MNEGWKVLKLVLKICASIALVFVLVYNGYADLDRDGWIPRTRNIEIYMAPDWFQGETRVCLAVQNLNEKKVFETDAMFCPSEIRGVQGHNMAVRFWGRISRPELIEGPPADARNAHWRCTRNEKDFTCKALD
jgi:hypothetical protein